MADTLVKHAFVSAIPEGGNPATIRTSNWNAPQLFTGGTAGELIVRDTVSATGAAWSATPTLTSLAVTGALTSPIGATGNKTFLKAQLSDNGAVGHYNFCVGHAANAGDGARGDHVLTIGYNTTPSGGRADTNEPAFEWRIEDYYAPTASPKYVEAQWQYYDATGANYRPIMVQIDRSNGGYLTNATTQLTGTSLSYLAMNGTAYVQMFQGELRLTNSCLLEVMVNNVASIKQAKASGSQRSLIYMNSTDQIVIGSISGDDLDIKWMRPLIALGGGAAPTLGTIGGSGPATAAQNTWMRLIDSTGAAFWVPAWK